MRRPRTSSRIGNLLAGGALAIALAIGSGPLQAAAATYPPGFPATYIVGQWPALVSPVSGEPNLDDIACPSAAKCYAVGQGGTVQAGSSSLGWKTVKSGTALDLASISCPAPSDCFAVGGTFGTGVIVSNARGMGVWRVLTTTPHQLRGISCPSPSTCVAAGDDGVILKTTTGGRLWKQRSLNLIGEIDAVTCPAGTTSCVAVGPGTEYLASSDRGSKWTQMASGVFATAVASIWCSATLSCFVGTGGGMWAADQGRTWVQIQPAGYRGVCLGSLCAFADNQAVLTSTNGGQTWITQSTGFSQGVFAISCTSAIDCYGVGDSGLIVHGASAFAISSPPAITITQFPNPNPNGFAQAIVAGPDGAMWATEFHGNAILRITTAGAQQEFPLATPSSEPEAVTAGPDGAIWFTESGTAQIGRITTAGAITEFPIPGYSCSTCNLADLVSGPDGALWFTELQADRIGRITTLGVITQFPLPPSMMPEHIVAGPDGNLWFTGYAGTINQMTTAGVLTSFNVPNSPFAGMEGIAVGPDGNLWVTATIGSWVGSITTGGVLLTQYPVHPSIEGITRIVTGPDGALWFADTQTLDRITVAGLLTEYPAPGESWVTKGPGATSLWYASFANSQVGKVTSSSW